jgi:hypothetical protein
MAPHTEVTAKSDIYYSEFVRENIRKLEAYGKWGHHLRDCQYPKIPRRCSQTVDCC